MRLGRCLLPEAMGIRQTVEIIHASEILGFLSGWHSTYIKGFCLDEIVLTENHKFLHCWLWF